MEAATAIPKDIVVVLDRSGSMKGRMMQIAREAAKTVVETLNPNDRVRRTRTKGLCKSETIPIKKTGSGYQGFICNRNSIEN